MFVQIHTLRDYSTALPNRGQDGLAKRTIYGGIERQRISSQSFKAAMRDNPTLVRTDKDGAIANDTLKDLASRLGLSISVRSALIGERKLIPALTSLGFGEGEAKEWSMAVMGLWRAKDAKGEADTPLVVGEKEIAALAHACRALKDAEEKPSELRTLIENSRKSGKTASIAQDAIKSMRALQSNAGIDGALFGRFATGIALNNVDSAVHVAHLVTVHPLFSVTDFFSVQDQLKTGDGDDRGGSHINTAELTSGLFYGYVVVDSSQLDSNFGELSKQERAEIVGWLVRAVAQVEPAAKLGSTAPYAGLRELTVEIGRRQPRSLIGAFERPVEATPDRSLSEEARHCLGSHASEMDLLMGAPEYRSSLRQHTKGPAPAVEAISERSPQNWYRWQHKMQFFTIRFSAPLMALQGPRIDGEPQSLPIPTRSLITGLVGSALGFGRGDHGKLQNLQDNMHVAVVVHRNGVEIHDYQIADLGKSHMRGPMWSSGTSIAEREGSQIAGLRQQQRPYCADADMTAVIEIRDGSLITAEQIVAALDQPARPLFFGRTSCPPASRLAGNIFEASSLEEATLNVARDRPGEIYLPAEAATPSWGDLPLSIPGRRDWTSFRHAGSDLYVVRQRLPAASE